VIARAWPLIRSPEAAWASIAAAADPVGRILLQYVVPLSLVPAFAWIAGSFAFPDDIGGAAGARSAGAILLSGAWTFAGSLITVVLLALAIAAVAPMYGVRRELAGAFRVAAFGLTPLWLAGALLVKPMLLLALLVAALHTCFVLHSGLRAVLGVRPGDASEYVAVSLFITGVASTFVGGMLGFLQIF
jgi:hypothetical protein